MFTAIAVHKLKFMIAMLVRRFPTCSWNVKVASGGARLFAARGKRLCCRPTPAVRSILMVITMALVSLGHNLSQ